eukprot:692085-Hanusia_phi.AAC.1
MNFTTYGRGEPHPSPDTFLSFLSGNWGGRVLVKFDVAHSSLRWGSGAESCEVVEEGVGVRRV